jgi:hypothetical protein
MDAMQSHSDPNVEIIPKTLEPLRTLRLLLARLERISADSVTAHRASGVRGAMMRMVETLEAGDDVSDAELKRLIESGYILLQRAAREKVR